MVALDQLSHLDMTLQLNDNGHLHYHFSATPDKEIILKEVAPNNLDNSTKLNLKQFTQQIHLELLGKSITPLVETVWE